MTDALAPADPLAMDPFEAAALRQRQAVRPAGGRGQSEFTDALAATILPGFGAAQSAVRGDYGTAAGEAALSALPATRFLPRSVTAPVAAGVAGALGMSPKATAAESEFSFIEDPAERAAAEAEYRSIKGYIKDKRTGESQYDRGETARLKREFMSQKQQEATARANTRREEEKKSGSDRERLQRFRDATKDAVDALTKDQKDQFSAREVPGNAEATIASQGAYLSQVAAQREQLTKGFSERNPEAMEWLQKGSYGVSAAIPAVQLWHRAATLRKAAIDAEKAFHAATKGKSSKAAEEALKLRGNQLGEAHANRGLGLGTVALAPTIPLAAAEAPNFIDLATLQNHPESPAYQHAWEMLNPWAGPGPWYDSPAAKTAVRALEEGVTATAAGAGMGETAARLRGTNPAALAKGTLKTIRDRETEMATKAADAAAKRQAAADARKAKAAAPDPLAPAAAPIPPAPKPKRKKPGNGAGASK